MGVACGDELAVLTTGVVRHGATAVVTPRTLFNIGSIAKPLTATAAMTLVDEGRLDLGQPVAGYLPEVKCAKAAAAAMVTPYHLLTHTGGLGLAQRTAGDGDLDGFARGLCNTLAFDDPPGEIWSYCNDGYLLLGAIVERLEGRPFTSVLKERVLGPAGMSYTVIATESTSTVQMASGHVRPLTGGESRIVPPGPGPRWSTPAGGTVWSTPADLLAFARSHLADGRSLVSSGARRMMQFPHVPIPDLRFGAAWGLGWAVDRWDGHDVFSHSGNADGQFSVLTAVADRDLAVVLLVNASPAEELYRELFGELFDAEFRIAMPAIEGAEPSPGLDLRAYTGRYHCSRIRLETDVSEGQLVVRFRFHGSDHICPLVPVGRHRFVLEFPDEQTRHSLVFCDFDPQGMAHRVCVNGRTATRRTTPAHPGGR